MIGQGGQKLRDTISSVGGPAEGFKQSGLVNLCVMLCASHCSVLMNSPKPGDETTDQVRLRGDSKLVKALKEELEKQVKVLQDTIVIGVVVPQSQHASKIGRGGSALQDLQRKTGAT